MQQALNLITRWIKEDVLNISPSIKTAVEFTKRTTLEGLVGLKPSS